MKTLKFLIKSIPFLLLFLFAISQTKWAKKEIKGQMVQIAKKHHIELSFDEMEELLPFKWTLKNAQVKVQEGQPLFAKKIVLRPSYFPFCITSIDIIEGSYCHFPFSLTAKGRFSSAYDISTFYIDSPIVQLSGVAQLSPSFKPLKGECHFHIPDLSECNPQLKGNLQGKIQLQSEIAHLYRNGLKNREFDKEALQNFDLEAVDHIVQGQGASEDRNFEGQPTRSKTDSSVFFGISLDFQDAYFKEFSLGALSADLMTTAGEDRWKGNLVFTSPSSFEGSLSFEFDSAGSVLNLDHIEVLGLNSHLYGHLFFDPHELDWKEGILHFEALHLEHFRALLPDSFLKGAAQATIEFAPANTTHIQGKVEHLSLYSSSLQTAEYELFFSKDQIGTLTIEGENLSIPRGSFTTFETQIEFGKKNAPFSFIAIGDPLTITMRGHWDQTEELISFQFQELFGKLFDEKYQIEKPFQIQWDPFHFKMTPLLLNLGTGHLASHVDLNPTSAFAKIEASKFPLQFISLFQEEFSLHGTSDFSFELASHDDHLSGNIDLSFHNINLISDAKKESIQLTGSLSIDMNEKEAALRGNMQTLCGQTLELSGVIPIEFSPFPFKLKSDNLTPFSGQLVMKSKAQDLLQFINIGDQQIEGWLHCNLQFSNNLRSPLMQGTLELQEGAYENLTLGLTLKNVEARAIAKEQEIKLITFKATDEADGSMSGSGVIKMDPSKGLVYAVNSYLNTFQAISLDTLDGKFTGNLLFSGNLNEAKAEGKLYVSEARFKIPEKLPPAIPNLPIKLINTPESLLKKPLKPLSLFPIHLDVDLEASKQVFLEWKGLNSQWKGNLHVTGNHLDVQAKGALSLIKGEYNLSSTTFSLTEGQMTFNDQSSPAMFLSLSGTCELPDTNVKVILRGPLFSPTLTFQSSPTMATSAILARILFNKDIAEISAIQAFQLAQTLLSLSGDTAPNIIERVRKTLYIDRLNVTTSDNDEILLQVSKYLTKGIMFTLSQGVDTQKVTMDVELNQGFLLQAEAGKGQKGKFSLKWNRNY